MWAYRSCLEGELSLHIERLVEDRRVLQLMNAEATAVPLTIQELLQASLS